MGDQQLLVNAGQDVFVPTTIAQKIFLTLEDPDFSKLAKWISQFVMGLILLGCVTYVMETMEDFNEIPPDCEVKIENYQIENGITDGSVPDDPSTFKANGDVDYKGLNEHCLPVSADWFKMVEGVCIIIFSVEYVLRLCTVCSVPESVWNIQEEALEVPDDEAVVKAPKGKMGLTISYGTSFMNLIDLVAIAPWYMTIAGMGGGGLGVIRVLRLTRVLRVLKSPKFAEAVKLFSLSLVASMPALSILFFFSMLAIILFGSLISFMEGGIYMIDDEICCPESVYENEVLPFADQPCPDDETQICPVVHVCQLGCYLRRPNNGVGPNEISPYTSIPASFYWVIVTMTTVGYGDLLPNTYTGRLLTIISMYFGIFGLALPITVIGANFSRQYELLGLEREKKARAQSELEKLKHVGPKLVASTSAFSSGGDGAPPPITTASSGKVAVRPAPGASRYAVSEVSDFNDEDMSLNGRVERPLMAVAKALPSYAGAIEAEASEAAELQALMKRLRVAVSTIHKS